MKSNRWPVVQKIRRELARVQGMGFDDAMRTLRTKVENYAIDRGLFPVEFSFGKDLKSAAVAFQVYGSPVTEFTVHA